MIGDLRRRADGMVDVELLSDLTKANAIFQATGDGG